MGNEKKFETMLIHEGYYPKTFHDSLTPPFYHTSTYAFANAQEGEKRFSGETDGYIYSRLGNPTVQILEDRICQLENGEGAIAFGSGMAAVSAILFHIVKSGSHVLCSRGIYGCTFGLLDFLNEKFDVSYTFSSLKTAEEIENAIQKNTSCIYVETPINPTMELIDIELVTSIAKNMASQSLWTIRFARLIYKTR